MTDFLVLREIKSIDQVIQDFYSNHQSYNTPIDILNSQYYSKRILFYIHSLRYHNNTLTSPSHSYHLLSMDGVTFNQYSLPIQSFLSISGLSFLLAFIQHSIQTTNKSIVLII